MREIKFRVWDTLNKEYEDASDVHIDLSNGELYEVVPVSIKSTLSAGLVTIYNQKRYILEQYTGLKDINGVEIYEGDVLIIGKLKGVVSYDGKGMLGFETKTMIYHLGHFNINNYEVIGNIHDKEEE